MQVGLNRFWESSVILNKALRLCYDLNNVVELTGIEVSRLKSIAKQFPQFSLVVRKLNQKGIKWALAAGSAFYVYLDELEKIDDIDIWIARSDKNRVADILDKKWRRQSSERHKAENINFGVLDFFTNCRKFKKGKKLLDYRWTDSVTDNLRKGIIHGVEYSVISPEDVALLKIPNPRGEKEKQQIKKLLGIIDNKYLNQRKTECSYWKPS